MAIKLTDCKISNETDRNIQVIPYVGHGEAIDIAANESTPAAVTTQFDVIECGTDILDANEGDYVGSDEPCRFFINDAGTVEFSIPSNGSVTFAD